MRYGAGGVTGEIRLPLPDHDRRGAEARALARGDYPELSVVSQRGEPPRLQGKRILVIEDEPLIAMDLEARLTAAGCQVLGPAGTAEHARQLIAEADCDAALVDGNLAGHPVDDLAVALTQKQVPFAFVTGYGRNSLPHGFQKAVVLSKPFHADDLLATVEALLDRPAVTPLQRKTT